MEQLSNLLEKLTEEHLFIILILMFSYKVISYIVDTLVKHYQDSKYQDKINNRMLMTDRVNTYIGMLSNTKYNTYILEFHNGCHNLNGCPFLKQSITMEKIQASEYSLINLVKDFYITPGLYQHLLNENYIVKTTIGEFENITPTIGRMMQNESDFDLWLVPIKKRSLIYGCIIIVGDKNTPKIENLNENLIELIKEDYINQK